MMLFSRLLPWSLSCLLVLTLNVEASAQPPQKATIALALERGSGDEATLLTSVTIADHWHVNSHTPTLDFLIPTELSLELPPGVTALETVYPEHKLQKFPFAEEPIAVYDGRFEIKTTLKIAPGTSGNMTAMLGYQACDDKQCLPPNEADATLELGATAIPTTTTSPRSAVTPPVTPPGDGAILPAKRGLLAMLFLALLGGLILNAMPCVLPVLSLKIFGLVKSAAEGRRNLVAGALATTAGIVFSFWLLALAAILAKGAGAAVGWGVQFQEPAFVAFLAVIVLVFALNMWGLFEIILPMGLAQIGMSGSNQGLAGHFFSGLFATLMATPCSAPFLGTAIGFALAESGPTIFLMFTAIGLGLALPYLLLIAFPGLGKLLPKPGEWMETLRQVMGFLLAGAAIWLFFVLSGQIGAAQLVYVQLALLLMALLIFLARSGRAPGLFKVAALIAAGFAVYLAATAEPVKSTGLAAGRHLEWVAFDEKEALRLAATGRPVFVDFTADWCLTCKANEKLVIDTPEIAAAFKKFDVVAMKGDWTHRDDAITSFLARYGRSAVPFYVLFRPGREPHAFGEIVTQAGLIAQLGT